MDDVLNEQAAYYRARAAEYDEWFFRKGRYDRGEELNRQWFDEVAILRREVSSLKPTAHILELACGTGLWTEELARDPNAHITAVDASPEMLNINRARVGREDIQYIQADLFAWEPETTYDRVFFSFWLSHVPPDALAAFLEKVSRATRPGGDMFIIDSLPAPTSSAHDHAAYDPGDVYHTRKLNDGREFRVIKVFYEAKSLEAALSAAGFKAIVQSTGNYFWYTHATKV